MTIETPSVPLADPAIPVESSRPRRHRRRAVAGIATIAVLSFGIGAGVTAVALPPSGTSALDTRGTTSAADEFSRPAFGIDPALEWAYPEPYDRRDRSTALEASEASTVQETGMALISTVVGFDAGEAAGTGMVLSSDGLVVTNHHVVAGATAVQVTVASTGKTYDAEVLGTDATHDIALLQLEDADGLTRVDTDTTGVVVGEAITAIGDAGGDGGSLTAADGTVLATGQSITVDDGATGTALTGLIEVDADVVPGDSGGAVVDADGQVIGMTTAASSGTTDITGYAVPIARVLRIVDTIIGGEDTATVDIGYDGFLGITLDPWDVDGATVASVVEGSAAAKLGLQAGDVVTRVDGEAIGTAQALQQALAESDAGDEVSLSWVDTEGIAHTRAVTLGAAPVR